MKKEKSNQGRKTNSKTRYLREAGWKRIVFWAVLFLVMPLADYLIAEFAMNTGCDFLHIGKYKIFMNCWFYGVAELIFLAISANIAVGIFGGAFFAAVFSAANIYLIRFTTIPLYVTDFTNADAAVNVVGNYDFSPNRGIWVLLIYLVVLGIVLFLLLPKIRLKHRWYFRLIAIPLAVLLVIGSCRYIEGKSRRVKWISLSTYRPIKSYRWNGGILSFMRSLRLLNISEPENYSLNELEELTNTYKEAAEAYNQENAVMKPNLIVIMNEAFSNLQNVGSFETNEPVLPVWDSLKENTIKGEVYVSVFGGHTANSEFEFLSGDSCAFLPSGVAAYQVYFNQSFPGLTSLMKGRGYSPVLAIHPHDRSGYNRIKVYNLMGFDRFIAKDDFTDPVQVRNLISDQADYDMIIRQYEEAKQAGDQPFYTFNVTMQNHGPYDTDYDNLPGTIQITSEHQEGKEVVERYLNLIHISDEQTGRLIDYFSKVDDPTVIVMFGDHQPRLPDEFYSSILGEDKDDLSKKENMNLYHTPFFIWANYDIEEEENVKLSLNFLQSFVMEKAGMQMSPYQYYLSELRKEIPVISRVGCMDTEGNFFTAGKKDSGYYERVLQYHCLCYNHLFDVKNRVGIFEE